MIVKDPITPESSQPLGINPESRTWPVVVTRGATGMRGKPGAHTSSGRGKCANLPCEDVGLRVVRTVKQEET